MEEHFDIKNVYLCKCFPNCGPRSPKDPQGNSRGVPYFKINLSHITHEIDSKF